MRDCAMTQKLFIIPGSFLIVSAILITPDLLADRNWLSAILSHFNQVPILFLLLFCLSYMYLKNLLFQSGLCKFSLTGAALFSLFTVLGRSYSYNNTWDYIVSGSSRQLISVVIFAGFLLLYYSALKLLFARLQKCSSAKGTYSLWLQYYYDHIFICSFVLIMLFWLPYIVIFYPGSVPWDGYRQLNQAMYLEDLSNHHPYFVSQVVRVFFSIGRLVSDNFGVFLYIVFQCLFTSLVFGYGCKQLKNIGCSPVYCLISTLFFGIVPAWGAYMQAIIKDSIFIPLFVLFFIMYIKLFDQLRSKEKITVKFIIVFTLVSILACLTRHNGKYIILPAIVGLLFISSIAGKKILCGSIFAIIAITTLYSEAFLPAANVSGTSVREMLSIPFQQTARYVKYYEQDLTPDEYRDLNSLLPLEGLGDAYDPLISDPVKNRALVFPERSILTNYLKTWAGLFFKHPGVYFQATINNTYGYYDPYHKPETIPEFQYYIQGEPVNTGVLDVHYVLPQAHKILINYTSLWQKIPLLTIWINPGFYTWLVIIMLLLILKRQQRKLLIIYIAPIFHILTSIASPVNGYLRYALPLMGMIPFLIGRTLSKETD